MRYLGVARPSGGLHAHLRRRVDRFGIDTTHFERIHNKGGRSPKRMQALDILVVRPEGSRRQKPELLRRALRESGRAYTCAECELADRWRGEPITLHVDHISGDLFDCRAHNLRFLCPNCHSQTATFAGRSKNSWRGMQEQADVMARNRLIIETALRNPSMGANNLTKLHPDVALLCGMETVRRVLKRVDLGSTEARRAAAGVSLRAVRGVWPWAKPTLMAFRDRLTASLVRRTEATTSVCADGALDSRLIERHQLLHRSSRIVYGGY